MPVQVDHDIRRKQVADVVARLIATRGLEAVTVRSTAEAAGFSTRVVSHYFAGKRELLLYCYRHVARRAEARLMAAARKHPGNMAAALDSVLPWNTDAREDWLVWVSFWGAAIADSEFSMIQRRQFSESRKRIQEVLKRSINQELDNPSIEQAASEILSSLMGMAVQAAFNPDEWPKARQQLFMGQIIAATSVEPGNQPPPELLS